MAARSPSLAAGMVCEDLPQAAPHTEAATIQSGWRDWSPTVKVLGRQSSAEEQSPRANALCNSPSCVEFEGKAGDTNQHATEGLGSANPS